MGRAYYQLEGKYFEYSTIVDAPISQPMTLEELKAYHRDEYGRSGMLNLEYFLPWLEERGTSSMRRGSIEDQLSGNVYGWGIKEFKEWVRGEREAPE